MHFFSRYISLKKSNSQTYFVGRNNTEKHDLNKHVLNRRLSHVRVTELLNWNTGLSSKLDGLLAVCSRLLNCPVVSRLTFKIRFTGSELN